MSVVKASVHGVKLLAHANMTVNNTRRQLLKQTIYSSKTLNVKLMFGDRLEL